MFNFWMFSEAELCEDFFSILRKINIHLLMLLQYEVLHELDRMVQWTVTTYHSMILILILLNAT
jgi:hypothetical protein